MKNKRDQIELKRREIESDLLTWVTDSGFDSVATLKQKLN
jgi:hypothetical protein